MTALEEIRVKLNGAQTDLEKLEANFQKMVELRDSLRTADTSLKTSASNLSNMTDAMERSAQSMKDCVSSLQSATSQLAKFDPLEITKKQEHFEQQLDHVKREVDVLARGTDELPGRIRESVDGVSGQSEKMSGTIVFLTLLVIVTLGISVANLYMAQGQQVF